MICCLCDEAVIDIADHLWTVHANMRRDMKVFLDFETASPIEAEFNLWCCPCGQRLTCTKNLREHLSKVKCQADLINHFVLGEK